MDDTQQSVDTPGVDDNPVNKAWLEDWNRATFLVGPDDKDVDAITGELKPGAGHVREVCGNP